MEELDDSAIRVLAVLEEHRRLSLLQIASFAELSISGTRRIVADLLKAGLLIGDDDVYSLNAEALKQRVNAVGKQLQAV